MGILLLEQIDDISAIDQYKVCIDAGYSSDEVLKIVSLYNREMPDLRFSGTTPEMQALQKVLRGLW